MSNFNRLRHDSDLSKGDRATPPSFCVEVVKPDLNTADSNAISGVSPGRFSPKLVEMRHGGAFIAFTLTYRHPQS